MNTDCEICQTHYEREQGYWLMSIFIGYIIFFTITAPAIIYLFMQRASLQTHIIAVIVEAVLLAPFVFRYSRSIWLHLDQILDPRELRENK